jgi:hypothetical protein
VVGPIVEVHLGNRKAFGPKFRVLEITVPKKWPYGICVAFLRALHCFGLVLAKGREVDLKCDGTTQSDSAVPPVRGGMIRVSRNVSILSVMLMMTVTVMATVAVAFAAPNEGGKGLTKVEVCHKGKLITVAEPAVEAHKAHGDDPAQCENEEPPTTPPPDGTTPELTTMATAPATAPVTLGDPISDTATLSGATSDATGTMTFKLYGPFTDTDPSTDTCVEPDPANNVAGNLVTTIDVNSLGSPDASGNYVVPSGDYTPTAVGRYQWVVSYSGDAKNKAVSSECKAPNEASVVTETSPTSTTG